MSTFKNRLIVEWGKNLKAFLNLDAGVVRGPLPGAARGAEDSPADKPASKAAKKPAPAELSGNGGVDDTEETSREHVASVYGYQRGLPAVGLLDVLPDLDESVGTHGLPASRMRATEMVLLKALAARKPGCRYLQIGSLRGSGAANVAEVAEDCVSLGLPEHGTFPENLVAERALYREESGGIVYSSSAFDHASFRGYFDLVFVDLCGSRESAKAATEAAFDLLRDSPDSAVVWRGYESSGGHMDWPLLAGVLDGCPGGSSDSLYHVSDTSCMLWPGGGTLESLESGANGPARAGKRFEVRFTAREAGRRLVVLDDGFPSLRSPFRVAEYNAYLEQWKDSSVYSNARIFRALGENRDFGEVLEDYARLYPGIGDRVLELSADINLDGDLAYCIFLNNISRFLPIIEENDAPFVFTLYPGGGFKLDQKDSDAMLERVCSSPNFGKVIATQKVTRDYLLDRGFCGPEEVEFVYGGVFPSVQLANYAVPKNEYGRDKDTFDVCFVAYKYKAASIKSKGYDMFVEAAKLLAKTHEDIVFHVVGTFEESDLDVSELGDRIRFHGPMATESFPAFYSNMDIILSPNAPFALQPGAFDGFPTGACIEAGLCGVAVFCSDPLDQNVAFEDGEEIVVVPRDARSISESVARYYDDYDGLRRLAGKGQEAFARVFDLQAQLEPRLRILSELLGESRLAGW